MRMQTDLWFRIDLWFADEVLVVRMQTDLWFAG